MNMKIIIAILLSILHSFCSLFGFKKSKGAKQDQSVQFTFKRPVIITDIQLCSSNPKVKPKINTQLPYKYRCSGMVKRQNINLILKKPSLLNVHKMYNGCCIFLSVLWNQSWYQSHCCGV